MGMILTSIANNGRLNVLARSKFYLLHFMNRVGNCLIAISCALNIPEHIS